MAKRAPQKEQTFAQSFGFPHSGSGLDERDSELPAPFMFDSFVVGLFRIDRGPYLWVVFQSRPPVSPAPGQLAPPKPASASLLSCTEVI
jgi:hypothetical protein